MASNYTEPVGFLDTYAPTTRVTPVAPKDHRTEFNRHTSGGARGRWNLALSKISSRYQYKPLVGDAIRLLSIAPGSEEDDIHCTIYTTSLKAVWKKYEALSYHWGTSDAETARNRIYIRDPVKIEDIVAQANAMKATNKLVTPTNQEKDFFVHDNLNHALRHLRSKDHPVVLWVDAICIDQRDRPDSKKEKEKQVQRMAEIYNSAHNVCIWLGLANAQTDLAMDFIQRIVGLNDLDALTTDPSYAPSWEAFTYLMQWEWFSRRWVVQEVALARQATLHCGAKCINWVDFADATSLLVDRLDQIRALSREQVSALVDIEAYGAVTLVEFIGNLSQKSPGGDIEEHLVGLETLVSRLLFFSTSNPHDAIYSLITLASNTLQRYASTTVQSSGATATGRPKKRTIDEVDATVVDRPRKRGFTLKIDYKVTAIQLFVQFVQQCIETSDSLDIICRYWAPEIEGIRFPSWILKIVESSFGGPKDALQGRRNGNSFVGAPLHGSRKPYNAALGTIAEVRFGPLETTEVGGHARSSNRPITPPGESPDPTPWDLAVDGILNAKGFQLATITKCSARIAGGIIPRDCLEKGGWTNLSTTVPDKLWRTLVADRDPEGNKAKDWYRRACLNCLTDVAITDVNGDMRVDIPYTSFKERHSREMRKFLSRVRSVVWNRQFFLANLWCDNCGQSDHYSLTCNGSRRSSTVVEVTPDTDSVDTDDDDLDLAHAKEIEAQMQYGLAPHRAKDGDIICILAGCTVPVVLRRRRHSNTYEFIGEAFVYGKMDGGATAHLDGEALREKLQWYTIK